MAVKGLALCHYRIQQGPLLLKGKEEAHHTFQRNILSVRESTLPASQNFSEDRVHMERRSSRTPNRSEERRPINGGPMLGQTWFCCLNTHTHTPAPESSVT